MFETHKILSIMKYAYLNPEQHTEEEVKQRSGKKKYKLFSQFCLEGKQKFAHYIGDGKLKLTQEGVREYHRLQSERLQKWFNFWLIIATLTPVATYVIMSGAGL